MGSTLRFFAFGLAVAASVSAPTRAQEPARPKPTSITGDTSHSPPGCSAAVAFAALQRWFYAISTGDVDAVPRAIAPTVHLVDIDRDRWWPDPHLHTAAIADLTAYVRRRSMQHEHIVWRSVRFDGWHGRDLWFSQLEYTRRADDWHGERTWRARGTYACREGITEFISRKV